MNRVLVCFEDRLTPKSDPADFGPYCLLVSCLADEIYGVGGAATVWKARQTVRDALFPQPLKGLGNLLRFCQEPEKDLKNVRSGVAVFDFDRRVELFPKAEQAAIRRLCKVQLRARIGEPQREGKPVGPLHVAFIDENTESLLAACPSPPTEKPTPQMRDQILLPVWTAEDRVRRDELRAKVRSFDYLTGRVLGLLRSP